MTRLVLLLLAACSGTPDDTASTGAVEDTAADVVHQRTLALGPLPALPDDPTNAWADDPTAAWFGRYLFYDPRLSGSGAFACSTCHDPLQGWGDGKALSEAAGTTGHHAPTLWNVGYQRWFFWDGRCDSLWCQAIQPIEAANEMGGSRLQLAHAIADNADLREGYEAVFGAMPDLSDEARFPPSGRPDADADDALAVAWASMTAEDQDVVDRILTNAMKAIAAFERTIVTGETAVDRYVAAYADGDQAGMDAALSAEAQAGLALFVGEGQCVLCHQGAVMSNLEFHSVGLGERAWLDPTDVGRYDGITKLRADGFNAGGAYSDAPDGEAAGRLDRLVQTTEQLGIFKVPGLRNVAASPPYMHGGHFDTLTDVVDHYNELDETVIVGHVETFMVPREWDASQVAALVAFLEALSAPPLDPTVLEAPDGPLPSVTAPGAAGAR
jgi:cytochrome c peroxidase